LNTPWHEGSFELTTWVVIGTNCKSNYHTMMYIN
jgi:hypothetical protein